jgi:hypothetical protein
VPNPAKREGKVERHIRLLAPLAFVSARLLSEIIDGAVAPDLTLTSSLGACQIRGLSKRIIGREAHNLEFVGSNPTPAQIWKSCYLQFPALEEHSRVKAVP